MDARARDADEHAQVDGRPARTCRVQHHHHGQSCVRSTSSGASPPHVLLVLLVVRLVLLARSAATKAGKGGGEWTNERTAAAAVGAELVLLALGELIQDLLELGLVVGCLACGSAHGGWSCERGISWAVVLYPTTTTARRGGGDVDPPKRQHDATAATRIAPMKRNSPTGTDRYGTTSSEPAKHPITQDSNKSGPHRRRSRSHYSGVAR